MTNATITHSVPARMSEDCLYLNVFADSRCTTENPCPVLVIIHGGAYQGDSPAMFNETHLINKYAADRLIIVLPAMRLGIFGLVDLGNETKTEPYNIAVYDIIQGLEWVRDELPALGGNTSLTTLFGYSSSAATLLTLLASPAMPSNLFNQVYISSGCPRLMPHFSETMSLSVLRYVGCNNTADLESQINCLRSKPATNLTDAMRATVNGQWWQIGVQSDSHFYPAPNLPSLRQYWKPKPMMLMSGANELSELEERPLEHICMHYLYVFGYYEKATMEACVQRYATINETESNFYYQDVKHTLARDIQHASNVRIAAWNAQEGQPTYSAIIAQLGHSRHVSDLYYLIGFHYDSFNHTEFETNMETFLVNAFKRFLRGQAPLDDWKPSNVNGSSYYYLTFGKPEDPIHLNETDIVEPEFRENQVHNQEAVDFWLKSQQEVELNASVKPQQKINLIEKSLPVKSLKSLSILPSRRLHPLHNVFLVILAITSSVAAIILILMLIDTFRNGRLLRRYSERIEEVGEDTALLVERNSNGHYTDI
ncbi:Carboxylic ester hydrolase [Aphelenchoides bicaudatus]|nr:Carboxylic ester hydrolase [Aphelenchoides bicaudatus]